MWYGSQALASASQEAQEHHHSRLLSSVTTGSLPASLSHPEQLPLPQFNTHSSSQQLESESNFLRTRRSSRILIPFTVEAPGVAMDKAAAFAEQSEHDRHHTTQRHTHLHSHVESEWEVGASIALGFAIMLLIDQISSGHGHSHDHTAGDFHSHERLESDGANSAGTAHRLLSPLSHSLQLRCHRLQIHLSIHWFISSCCYGWRSAWSCVPLRSVRDELQRFRFVV